MQNKEFDFSPGDFSVPNLKAMPDVGMQSFKVKFGTGSSYRQTAPNSFSFHGKGEISVQPETVKIAGKRHRLFWFGVPEEHTFRCADIYDARANGKYVRFDVHPTADFGLRQVGFIAADKQTAEEIVALLPQQQTESFALDHAERSDFQTRLDAMSPSAPVTTALVALNIIIFLLMALNGAGFMVPNGEVAIRWGSNYGPMTLEGQWWRLFTSTFIHFGVLHVALNMLALYQTGRMVERIYGSLHFLLLYVFAGLAGSMVSLLWHPMINSAGASGAIFGVFGGLLAFMMNSKNAVPRSIMNEHRNSTMAFIGYNLLNGFTHAGIDNGAHIGGLLGGIVIGFMLARPLEITARTSLITGRLIVACFAGILLLGALGYPLSHPGEEVVQERHFNETLRAFGPQESRAIKETNDLIKKLKAKTISDTDFADMLEQKIGPQWQRMYDEFSKNKLSASSKSYPLQQAMLRYFDDRINACKLLTESIRKNDASLMTQANEATKNSQLEVETIRKLSAQ